jgi:hypothetical protein
MLVPGLGQLYNGQPLRALVMCLLMAGVGLGSLAWILLEDALYLWLAAPLLLVLLVHIWVITDAMVVARKRPDYRLRRCNHLACYLVFCVVVVALAQAIQLSVADACFDSVRLEAAAFEGTLEAGDRLLVNTLGFGAGRHLSWLRRVPAVDQPVLVSGADQAGQHRLGRCIATPSQVVEVANGEISVDGVLLRDSWLQPMVGATAPVLQRFEVASGQVGVVIGDAGSSELVVESVAVGDILGLPMMVFWSYDEAEQRIQIERIGIPVL